MKCKALLLTITISLLLSGCQSYNSYSIVEKDSNNYPPINPFPKSSEVEVTLYFPNTNESFLSIENRVVNIQNEDIERVVIRELLKGTEQDNLKSLIPNGTELSSLATRNGIVYINFTNNILENNYDERREALLLYSIVNSLTALDNIDKVQIYIQGESRKLFNKYYQINEPLEFSDLIVENQYHSPLETIKEYYDIVVNKDYCNLNDILLFEGQTGVDCSTYRSYYETLYKDFSNYEINEYFIENYGKDSNVFIDITKYYEGQTAKSQSNKQIILTYDGKRFRILADMGGID